MDDYIVYIHTNKANGMKYIGITKRPTWRRWGHGSGYSKNPRFYNAIKKYTWEGFTHEVVASGLTKEQAEVEEVRLIKLYDSTDRKKGYNLDNGGSGSNRVTEATKKRISEAGRVRFEKPEEHEKLSKAAIKRNQDIEKFANICEGNRKRWQRPEEHQKITHSLKDYYKNNPDRRQSISDERRAFFAAHPDKKTTKPVIQMTTDGKTVKVWESAASASRSLGIDFRNISAVCKQKKAMAGGYCWRFAVSQEVKT